MNEQHSIRDLSKLETQMRGWCPMDLMDARIRRQKGNHPGYAGYRQKGRGEARIAKRVRRRIDRRIGKMMCDVQPLGEK